ncbi:MAG: efflux RND transporter periplasmic adaptor subunit [Rhodocyclales bacterium]|nr:efflux RND transporter periplasmic adaptor subunit [Rhodocyclales bacterium]
MAAGTFWFAEGSGDGATQYRTAPVERGSIEETVAASGTLQPFAYVDVGTQVTGQLKALHVVVGQRVAAGELVAEIDPVLLSARVDATRATLKSLLAQLADRMAQERLAQQQLERNRKLFTEDAVSQEVLEQSAAAAVQATAQVNSFKAQIEQFRSELRSDEANLRYTKIYSPLAGTVVSITARQGQTLVASQQAPVILRVADLLVMTVWAQVSEADVAKLQVAMPVYFNTLGSERRWHSAVRQILPTPDTVNNVILYNVLFDVANPEGVLRPQMSAQVYVVLGRAADALLVPTAALQPLAGKAGVIAGAEANPPTAKTYRVQVLRGDGETELREVQIGLATRQQAEVLSGLHAGEAVVLGIAAAPGGTRSGSWLASRP